MATNNAQDDRLTVGQIVGVYGIKGWVKVKSFTQPEDNILAYKPWRLRTAHGVKEVEVDQWQARPQGLVCHIVGYDDRDLAAALVKAHIDVPANLLPDLPQDEYYWHQLIGLQVISDFGPTPVHLGEVKQLLETGANDVLVVRASDPDADVQERLVPYVPGVYVTKVDLPAGEMRVNWDPDF